MQTLHKVLPLAIAAVFAQGAGAAQASAEKAGSAQQAATAGAPVAIGTTRTASGTIESIDSAQRRVVIKGDDGGSATMFVGPQVKDFENLKTGDKVTLQFNEAIALAVAKSDKGDLGEIRRRVESAAVSQAPAGGKPGIAAMERTTVAANVFEIDKDSGTLTLRGTEGKPMQMKVRDKQALKDIEKNDQVIVSYVEASVLSIKPGSSESSAGSSGGGNQADKQQSGSTATGSTATSSSAAGMK